MKNAFYNNVQDAVLHSLHVKRRLSRMRALSKKPQAELAYEDVTIRLANIPLYIKARQQKMRVMVYERRGLAVDMQKAKEGYHATW